MKDFFEGLQRRVRLLRIAKFGERGKAAFARALGISPNTYEHYEHESIPPPDIVAKMFAATKVNPMWLYHGVGPSILDLDSTKIEDAASLITALWDENDRLKSGLAAESAEKYQATPADWLLAAIRIEGRAMEVRTLKEASGPLGVYTGGALKVSLGEKRPAK